MLKIILIILISVPCFAKETMRKWALVYNGKIENVIIWDGKANWHPPKKYKLIEISKEKFIGIGDLYDGKKFSKAKSK